MINDIRPPLTVQLMAAVRALPTHTLKSALYVALADKDDLTGDDLEEIGNRINRLAWDRQRNENNA